ncbi:MAG TPA: hypothetical protein VFV38_34850 [Ktedonobacteraceae bacterium]|nr:hypothetical protein [Ktedonobacteraceae bacterium]
MKNYNWVEAYIVYRWTTWERSILLLAADLAKLAAQQFGTGEEKDDSLPFRVMAEEVMRFRRSKSFLVCWQAGHSG